MTPPLFDFVLYQKLSSRLGRLEKRLSQKTYGSQAYLKAFESVKRAQLMKKKFIIAYLKELAQYAVSKELLPCIETLKADGVLKDTLIYRLVKTHWSSYLNQQQRIRLKLKEQT